MWAAELERRESRRERSPRLGDAVMAVDQVVAPGGDFGKQDRTKEIGCADGSFVETLVIPIIGNVCELDGLDGEAFRMSSDEGEESRDIDDEDSIRIKLIAGLRGTGLEFLVELESGPDSGSVGLQGGPLDLSPL